MPATVSLIAMLRNQLDDECNAMMELCKSDVESGPNQLALTTVIDNKEQVKIYLAEMQARLKAIVGPSLVVMEHDPIFDTIHCGTINNDVQLNCVTGGVLAVVTLLSEAKSLVVAVTDETATLRVKHLYTDEMFDAEFEVTPNMHHPDMIAIIGNGEVGVIVRARFVKQLRFATCQQLQITIFSFFQKKKKSYSRSYSVRAYKYDPRHKSLFDKIAEIVPRIIILRPVRCPPCPICPSNGSFL